MMEWKGAWSTDVDYKVGAVVTNGGGTYVALQDVAKNNPPPSSAWGVVAAPPQPSVVWKGAWSKDLDYTTGAVVTNGGGTYVALQNVAKNSPPPPSSAWGVVAAPPQPSVEWKGAWSKDFDYTTGALVTNGGGTYVALQNVAKNNPPPSSAWGVVAAPPASVHWKGPWVPNEQYQVNDAVSYDGASSNDVAPQTEEAASSLNSYIAVKDPPEGTLPTDRSYWEALSSNEVVQDQANLIIAAISASAAVASTIAAVVTAGIAWKALSLQAAEAAGQAGLALGQAGQALGQAGQALGQAGQAKGDAAQAKSDAAQAKGDAAQAKGDAGQAKVDAGQAKVDAGQAKVDAGQARTLSDETVNLMQQKREEFILYGTGGSLNI
jgi:hypothetical protein